MAHPPELKQRAQELRKQGWLVKAIATEINVPEPTVIRWTNPALEERERKRARKLKYSQGRKCAFCKTRRVSNDRTLCRRCYRERGQRVWTEEKLIEAVQSWALEHGRQPRYQDWQRSGKGHPAVRSITEGPRPPFKKWSDLIRAAGFEPGVKFQKRKPMSLDKKRERSELRRQMREEKIKKVVQKGEQKNEGQMAQRA